MRNLHSQPYLFWPKLVREQHRIQCNDFLISYKRRTEESSPIQLGDGFVNQVSLQLDLDLEQSRELVQYMLTWIPPSSLTLELVQEEHYAHRIVAIREMLNHHTKDKNSIIDLLHRLLSKESFIAGTSPPVSKELISRWKKQRECEEHLFLQGLQSLVLDPVENGTLLSSLVTSTNVRAWYSLLLPLLSSNSTFQWLPFSFFTNATTRSGGSDEETEVQLRCVLEKLAVAFMEGGNLAEKRGLRNYLEILLTSPLFGETLYCEETNRLLAHVASLGFGPSDPGACDAFWNGQYPGLLHFLSSLDGTINALVSSTSFFTNRTFVSRLPRVNLSSRDLSKMSLEESDEVEWTVWIAHSHFCRKQEKEENKAMNTAQLLVRYVMTTQSKSLLRSSLHCLLTLCQQCDAVVKYVEQCGNQEQEESFLINTLVHHGLYFELVQFLPYLVNTYGRHVTQVLFQLLTTPLVKKEDALLMSAMDVLLLLPATYFTPHGEDLLIALLLRTHRSSHPEVFDKIESVLCCKWTQQGEVSQALVLHLFRHRTCALLSTMYATRKSPVLLGLVGPVFLRPVMEEILSQLDQDDNVVMVLEFLLLAMEFEPEFVRLWFDARNQHLFDRLHILMREKEEVLVLQASCALLALLLKKQFVFLTDAHVFAGDVMAILNVLDSAGVEFLLLKSYLLDILSMIPSSITVSVLEEAFPLRCFNTKDYAAFLGACEELISVYPHLASALLLRMCSQQLMECTHAEGALNRMSRLLLVLFQCNQDHMELEEEDVVMQALTYAVLEKHSGEKDVIQLVIFALSKTCHLRVKRSVRQQLLPLGCELYFHDTTNFFLFLECCGEDVVPQHALLHSCLDKMIAQASTEKWALLGLISSAKVYSRVLIQLQVESRLFSNSSSKENFELHLQLVNALLGQGDSDKQPRFPLFFSQYSTEMKSALSQFRSSGNGAPLTVSGLKSCTAIVRCCSRAAAGGGGGGIKQLDELLRECFFLFEDVVMGSGDQYSRGTGLLEEFAQVLGEMEREENDEEEDDEDQHEMSKRQRRRTSAFMLRCKPLTVDEEVEHQRVVMIRAQTAVGPEHRAVTLARRKSLDSPFRRNSFSEKDAKLVLPKPVGKGSPEGGDLTEFHLHVEGEIETLLMELFLLFLPFQKRRMKVFDWKVDQLKSGQQQNGPDVGTVLSVLTWLSKSGIHSFSQTKERLAWLALFSLYLALQVLPPTVPENSWNKENKEKTRKELEKVVPTLCKRMPQEAKALEQMAENINKVL